MSELKFGFNYEGLKGPEEPAKVLFHGTTKDWYQKSLIPDGTYKHPDGGEIWMDSQTAIPLTLARVYGSKKNEHGILLIIKSELVNARRPKEAVRTEIIRPNDYWITHMLPAGSFVAYDINEDKEGLYQSHDLKEHLERMRRICLPIGIVPDYVEIFEREVR